MKQLCLLPLTPEELQQHAKGYADPQATQRKLKPSYTTITVGGGETFVFAHCKPIGRKKSVEVYRYLVHRFDDRALAVAVKDHLNGGMA